MRRRLYHRIFASLLGFVLLALGLSALASHLLLWDLFRGHLGPHLQAHAARFARELPGPDRPAAELQAAVERLAASWPLHIAVWSADGRRLAFTSTDLPGPTPGERVPVWLSSRSGPAFAVPIPDGRCLVLQARHFPRPGGFLFAVLALAGLLALASYPVARMVTRRLEALEAGVRRLGEGDLAARVEVTGADELASLATSFNQAAGRLQGLVEAQRRVLASASHELRSPLARLRMALELARDDPEGGRERINEAVVEVGEIDALVEELLLAGRLELQAPLPPAEAIDIGALLAEEAARTGASTRPQAVRLYADPRLLRVLVRNLLENARHHGLGSTVEAGVELLPDGQLGARVWVADRGPGVPGPEREHIFEPFYRPAGHAEGRDAGIGLGLYLVRRIAEAYGGTATCRPREGGGTLFEVTLRSAAMTE
ncbi:MAG: ATP-binding protein [Thermoanaerobaculales bacterium]